LNPWVMSGLSSVSYCASLARQRAHIRRNHSLREAQRITEKDSVVGNPCRTISRFPGGSAEPWKSEGADVEKSRRTVSGPPSFGRHVHSSCGPRRDGKVFDGDADIYDGSSSWKGADRETKNLSSKQALLSNNPLTLISPSSPIFFAITKQL